MPSANFLPMLADRVFNTPLAIAPAKAEAILAALQGRIGISEALPPQLEQSAFLGQRRHLAGGVSVGRAVGSTALITIDGSLVNRGGWIDAQSGVVSYDGIAAQLAEAAGDPEIKSIVIDMNSYGGEASGMSTLAAKVRAARKSKRVIAVVNDVAASAGYGIASAADEIVISPTSMLGSIGVVLLHLDRSVEMEVRGVRPTLVHAGARKVDGNPFEPLPESVREDMQNQVMRFYDLFLADVAQGRGRRFTAAKARATEAAVYVGESAIKAGLADRIGTLEEVLGELSRPAARGGRAFIQTKGNFQMNDDETEIRASERKRIKAILGLPEATDRRDQALALALDSNLEPAAAASLLASMPQASPPTPSTPPIEDRQLPEVGFDARGGLAAPNSEAAKVGWGKVVAKHNSPFDKARERKARAKAEV